MGITPDGLAAWEAVLSSNVAVALLLLGGLIAVTGPLVAVVLRLYRENQVLHREFRDHLAAETAFVPALENAQKILELADKEKNDVVTPA